VRYISASRRARGSWPKYLRQCALKITKRKFMQAAVAQITQSGAAAAINGSAASCALPA
jgi:hypothetical protein